VRNVFVRLGGYFLAEPLAQGVRVWEVSSSGATCREAFRGSRLLKSRIICHVARLRPLEVTRMRQRVGD